MNGITDEHEAVCEQPSNQFDYHHRGGQEDAEKEGLALLWPMGLQCMRMTGVFFFSFPLHSRLVALIKQRRVLMKASYHGSVPTTTQRETTPLLAVSVLGAFLWTPGFYS
jgi:hypothetical protein